jgi:hypothetical protein
MLAHLADEVAAGKNCILLADTDCCHALSAVADILRSALPQLAVAGIDPAFNTERPMNPVPVTAALAGMDAEHDTLQEEAAVADTTTEAEGTTCEIAGSCDNEMGLGGASKKACGGEEGACGCRHSAPQFSDAIDSQGSVYSEKQIVTDSVRLSVVLCH